MVQLPARAEDPRAGRVEHEYDGVPIVGRDEWPPSSKNSFRGVLTWLAKRGYDEAVEVTDGPTVLRFPKATAGTDIDTVTRMDGIDILHRSRRRPLDVLLVAVGALADACLQAAAALEDHGLGVTVADPRWVIPVNPALTGLAARHDLVVTAEDSSRTGGTGALLAQACADSAVTTPVRNLGLPCAFIEHGNRPDLLAHHGLSGEHIAQTVRRYRSEPVVDVCDPNT